MWYKYTIEMFKDGIWELCTRYYTHQKGLDDFDLKDVEGKRKNARYIGTVKIDFSPIPVA